MQKPLLIFVLTLITSLWLLPCPSAAKSTKETDGKVLKTPKTFIESVTGMEFVFIQGGCYQMGSASVEKEGRTDEGPVHEVCLDDFWMGRHEVTNAQYRKFRSDHDSRAYFENSLNNDNQPVVYVNWADSVDFSKWVSKQSTNSFRLPTEAEWEYAARGGSTTARYWDKDKTTTCANANIVDQAAKLKNIGFTFDSCTDGFAVSAPVGTFKPNAYGLYDTLGNVWEWTADWYADKYKKTQLKNPRGPKSGQYRVLRGGSWFSTTPYARAAQRSWYRPDSHNNSLGFRLVMSMPK